MCVCTNTCLCGNNLPAWTGKDLAWARHEAEQRLRTAHKLRNAHSGESFPSIWQPSAWLVEMTAETILADGERKPVDVDIIEARKICAEFTPTTDIDRAVIAKNHIAGKNDDWRSHKLVLAAIKRGRELEKEGM